MRILLSASLVVLLAACASDSKPTTQALSDDINCATAEGQLRVLRSEKIHTEGLMSNDQATYMTPGVLGVGAGGQVELEAGLVGGTMLPSDYNSFLDRKIELIKEKCGL